MTVLVLLLIVHFETGSNQHLKKSKLKPSPNIWVDWDGLFTNGTIERSYLGKQVVESITYYALKDDLTTELHHLDLLQ